MLVVYLFATSGPTYYNCQRKSFVLFLSIAHCSLPTISSHPSQIFALKPRYISQDDASYYHTKCNIPSWRFRLSYRHLKTIQRRRKNLQGPSKQYSNGRTNACFLLTFALLTFLQLQGQPSLSTFCFTYPCGLGFSSPAPALSCCWDCKDMGYGCSWVIYRVGFN